jgi:NAD(P)-dependent dehydrogenase (short-subunit alcohol dehydrogenase family)
MSGMDADLLLSDRVALIAGAAGIEANTGRRALARRLDVRDARAVCRLMLDRGGCKIVNLLPGEEAYAASKAGLQALLDRDPGLERRTAAGAALRRIAEPAVVARVALFPASSLSDHVTGERLLVNGGEVMSQ